MLIPAFLLALIVIHELGHTGLARLWGDPNAVFYLIKFDEYSGCMIGCKYYDVSKLSWGGNLTVSIGGLFAGQLAALTALFLLRRSRDSNPWLGRILTVIAFSFAFFDVPWQVFQGLAADLDHSKWPTGSDLTNFLSLLQMQFDINQALLKGLLFLFAALYLAGFVWLYRRHGLLKVRR